MPIATANPLHRSAPSPTSFPQQICLLADDLTGACDAAAAFLPTGRAVRVWLGGAATFSATEPVQAYNTDSRSLSPVKASRIVSRSAAALASNPQTLFFKKIDSAARGPFAAEILAALRASRSRAVLLAPAFPAAGRTVCHGILEIQDATGQRTQIVREGMFTGYLSSRETAPVIGRLSSGAMRADGYNRVPIVRMTNINLEPGDWTLDELISVFV